MPTVLV